MLNTAQKGKEADRGQKSGNITVDFLAEPVSDLKGCVLSVIIRDNSFFVLASKRSDWKGDGCDYYRFFSVVVAYLPADRYEDEYSVPKKYLLSVLANVFTFNKHTKQLLSYALNIRCH